HGLRQRAQIPLRVISPFGLGVKQRGCGEHDGRGGEEEQTEGTGASCFLSAAKFWAARHCAAPAIICWRSMRFHRSPPGFHTGSSAWTLPVSSAARTASV